MKNTQFDSVEEGPGSTEKINKTGEKKLLETVLCLNRKGSKDGGGRGDN